jgi:hypothetical protein
MAHKYKLKEQPSPNLAKQGGYKIGDVSYSKDGDTKYVVNTIDPVTGQVGWKVIPLPAFDKLNTDLTNLVRTAKGVYGKTKDDEKFRGFYEEIRKLRNQVRTHLRNEYPDEYKRMSVAEDVDEVSTSGGSGAYLGKYAFKKPKKQEKLPEGVGATLGPGPKAGPEGVKDNYYVKKFKYKLVPKDKKGNYVQKGSGLEVKNF